MSSSSSSVGSSWPGWAVASIALAVLWLCGLVHGSVFLVSSTIAVVLWWAQGVAWLIEYQFLAVAWIRVKPAGGTSPSVTDSAR